MRIAKKTAWMRRNVIFWGRFNNRGPEPVDGAPSTAGSFGAAVRPAHCRSTRAARRRTPLGRTALRPLRVRGDYILGLLEFFPDEDLRSLRDNHEQGRGRACRKARGKWSLLCRASPVSLRGL